MADVELVALYPGVPQLKAVQPGDKPIIADITKSRLYQIGALDSPSANPMLRDIIGMFPVVRADDGTEESMYMVLEVPGDWKAGTDLSLHFHFMNVDLQSGTNSVITGIEFAAVAGGETGTPGTTIVEVTDALALNQAALIKGETSDLVILAAAIAAGDLIGVRVYRKAAAGGDDVTGDIAYSAAHLNYTSNTIG